MADDQGTSKLFGEGLPGTGGDFIDPNDTEGHARLAEPTPTGLDEPGPTDSARDDDTEGHSRISDDSSGGQTNLRGWGDDGDGRTRSKFIDDQDVEGHLYRTGPTTSGDFAKRGPTNNPHGER
jgi:hypothetical protein